MSGDDDKPSWVERDKLSFSELDRRRKEKGPTGEASPRGAEAEKTAREATKQYIKAVDDVFTAGGAGAEGAKLAEAMREARGTDGLADACRAYRDTVGVPRDTALLSLFLDSGDSELVVGGLGALLEASRGDTLEVTRGLRMQLRMLAEDADDAVAEAAEELLEQI